MVETEVTVGAVVSEVVVVVDVLLEDVLSVDADEPPSSLLAQEMIMRLIISEKIMSICLIRMTNWLV